MKPKRSRPPLSLIDLGGPVVRAPVEPAPEAEAAKPEPDSAHAAALAAEAADAELFAEAAATAPPPRTIPVARPRERDGLARHAVLIAIMAGLAWAGALVAFVLGFQSRFGAFDYEPFQIGVIAVLALLPFVFMLLAAQAVRQGARLAAATRQARELAQDVAIPAALAADQVGGAMEAMRLEIARAAEAANAAQAPLTVLRSALAEETQKLQAATHAAMEASRNIADALSRERGAVGEASEALLQQAQAGAEALRRQIQSGAETLDRERGLAGEAGEALRLKIEQSVEALRRTTEESGQALALQTEETGEVIRRHTEATSETILRHTEETGEFIRQHTAASSEALRRTAEESAEALTAQTRLVSDASDLAQIQLAEAQAGLAARAADLSLAAAHAETMAARASEALGLQSERLGSAGEAVGSNLSRLQAELSRERDQLFALAGDLRQDQAAFAVAAEDRAAGLAAAVAEAREGAGVVAAATEQAQDSLRSLMGSAAEEMRRLAETAQVEAREGAAVVAAATEQAQESLRSLIATAADEMRRLAEAAQAEQAQLDAGARAALEAFGADAAGYRDALADQTRASLAGLAAAAEETRAAAALPIEEMAERMELRAKAVRAELDQLGEAAFAAGQRADQAYDARMAAARALIDESSELVDQAGLRAAERIGTGLAGARSAVDDLAALVELVEQRIQQLPDSAREKAESIRAAVERGAADLAQAARKTAEETQAIDAAFQERVRRNYEVLSEAVRLMGRVAAAAEPPVQAAAPAPVPPAPRPPPPPAEPQTYAPQAYVPQAYVEEPAAQPIAVGERPLRGSQGLPTGTAAYAGDPGLRPAALTRPAAGAADMAAAMRPRLRLTPAGAEPAAPPAQAPHAAGDEEWTWKELLTSIEDKPPPAADDGLADRMIAEIETLGVDTEALLPAARTEEIAAVLHTGDGEGAREVVRMLAGTAVRRLAGRLLSDDLLRAEAEVFARRYQGQARDAIRRDRSGAALMTLLGSELGRVFLLLDAAAADL